MIVRFTRLNPTHHRLDVERDDGTRASRELETRSTFAHDLVHFALESEGGLSQGFFGALARGASYETEAAIQVEYVVGPLQGLLKTEFDPAAFVERFRALQLETGAAMPTWLTVDLVNRATKSFRALEGHWRGTPFGQSMELRFDY